MELDDEVLDIRRVRTPKRTISYEKELVSLYGIGARSWTFGYLPGLHPTENFFLKTTSSYVISNELCASMWGADELKDEQYICTTENRGPCFVSNFSWSSWKLCSCGSFSSLNQHFINCAFESQFDYLGRWWGSCYFWRGSRRNNQLQTMAVQGESSGHPH